MNDGHIEILIDIEYQVIRCIGDGSDVELGKDTKQIKQARQQRIVNSRHLPEGIDIYVFPQCHHSRTLLQIHSRVHEG